MSVRDWQLYYDDIKREVHQHRRNGVPISKSIEDKLTEKMCALNESLKTLQTAPMEYEMSSSELARRQVILENLQKQIIRLASMTFANGGGGGGGIGIGTDDSAGDIHNPLMVSEKALLQRQREVLKQQDLALLDIERGVDRLHGQAVTINEEVKIQTKILDDLEIHVDVATEGLVAEAKHADDVRRKANNCYLYLCLILEVVILAILIVIYSTSKT